jgi:hypothetical protein
MCELSLFTNEGEWEVRREGGVTRIRRVGNSPRYPNTDFHKKNIQPLLRYDFATAEAHTPCTYVGTYPQRIIL